MACGYVKRGNEIVMKMFITRHWKAVVTVAIVCLLAGTCALWAANWVVSRAAIGRAYEDATAIPPRTAGLVLGCVKHMPGGRVNPFFTSRVAAAAALFHEGKVNVLIVSGDNHVKGYDEPSDMKDSLVAAGVPSKRVYCDYAGFRTLDSVIRAKEVFGQSGFIIVSQHFHNERALYIARRKGIDAIALDAGEVPFAWAKTTYLREYLARVQAVLDVELLGTKPKFLGEPVDMVLTDAK